MKLFLRLYILILATMLGVGWTLEQLWLHYGNNAVNEDRTLTDVLVIVEQHLQEFSPGDWPAQIVKLNQNAEIDISLMAMEDITGDTVRQNLLAGQTQTLSRADGRWWALKSNPNGQVIAVTQQSLTKGRDLFEWFLLFMFYAAIGLALMIWVWPLSRDIYRLQAATKNIGANDWRLNIKISPRSQIRALSESFVVMVERIKRLIQSHKDLTNSISHEIKTPLARMKFAAEIALDDPSKSESDKQLRAIKDDIDRLNQLVTATMRYAVLERMDFDLKLGQHAFYPLLTALADRAKHHSLNNKTLHVEVECAPITVCCDLHLTETLINNLIGNAARYANGTIKVSFDEKESSYRLTVEDDGPGIPVNKRDKIFSSFSQLEQSPATKGGFGLGLAIVKRIAEWHRGAIKVEDSDLGGAKFIYQWPATLCEDTNL